MSPRHTPSIPELRFLTSLLLSLLLVSLRSSAHGETADPALLHERIAQEIKDLALEEKNHTSAPRLAWGWAHLAIDYESAADFTDAESSFTRSLHLLGSDPANATLRTEVLDHLGSLYLDYNRLHEARNCRLEGLKLMIRQGDALGTARARSHLAEVDLASRKYKDAQAAADQAYQSLIALQEPRKVELVSSLVVLTYARCGLHDCASGLVNAQQAVDLSRSAFAQDAMPTAAALLALGYAQLKNGAPADAEATTQQALQIFKLRLTPPDPRLMRALAEYRDCLLAQHKKLEAQQVRNQLAEMGRQAKPSCTDCSVSVYGLSNSVR